MDSLGTKRITQRGFSIIEFTDSNGLSCSLQESSSDTPSIWLGINHAEPKIMAIHAPLHNIKTNETVGWVPYPYPIPDEVLLHTRMHLNIEQVIALISKLQSWVATDRL